MRRILVLQSVLWVAVWLGSGARWLAGWPVCRAALVSRLTTTTATKFWVMFCRHRRWLSYLLLSSLNSPCLMSVDGASTTSPYTSVITSHRHTALCTCRCRRPGFYPDNLGLGEIALAGIGEYTEVRGCAQGSGSVGSKGRAPGQQCRGQSFQNVKVYCWVYWWCSWVCSGV